MCSTLFQQMIAMDTLISLLVLYGFCGFALGLLNGLHQGLFKYIIRGKALFLPVRSFCQSPQFFSATHVAFRISSRLFIN